MDEPTRRAWGKPELIVLVRSGPEEAVLSGCKGGSWYGYLAVFGQCTISGCLYCNAHSSS